MVNEVFRLLGELTDEMNIHSNCFSSTNRYRRIPSLISNKRNKLRTEVNVGNLSVVLVQFTSEVVPLTHLIVESVLGGIVIGPVNFIDVFVVSNDESDCVVPSEVIVLDAEVMEV